ncbi:putative PAS/PAC sensor-containing diguanylate cyclase/phosphodiesterase [Magnetofaba australis IT-1]|uniref:Putative PAS/PAC sensor-containing diguanylate cyclase/phosphodiesterase n=2 Tax=Magnetofaba TaxID=1472292 RepID=A0A1Y2K780_9PROT|nr:putative PAS/PAC sensor-containing diguanylate cyclase/phosphodiesterase [Magnetofaba australis IT-1]
MAVDIDWAPFEYIDEEMHYRGMAADYIRLVEERLNVQFNVDKERPWPQMVEAVKARDLDLFSCVVKTPAREKYAIFTKPYLSFPMVIVTRNDTDFIDGVQDLIDHKRSVSVVKSYASHDILVENHPELRIAPAKTVKLGLEAVAHGKTDAFIGNLAVVGQVMREHGLTNLSVSGQTPYRFELAMAVRKDWQPLVPILQKALDDITQEERDQIFNRWIRVEFSQKIDWSSIAYYVLAAFAALMIVVVWNRILQREIDHRKKTEAFLNNEIQQREKAEERLTRSRESLAHAQQIAHIGNWDWDIQAGDLEWSDEIYRIFGQTPQAFSATYEAFLNAVHPDDRQMVQDAVKSALENPDVDYSVEHRVIRPDGEERIVYELGDIRRDASGAPVLMRGTVQDVTDFRKTEESLELSRLVIENASEAIVITNKKGLIVDINPAYEQVTGYARAEVLGQDPSITSSGRHDKAFYQEMWKTLHETGCWSGEIWDRRKSGEVFPKWLSINIIRDSRNEIANYVGIFTDITHQKATEEALEQMAFYDALTKLPNRTLFRERLNREIVISERENQKVAVLFIDLDRFKYVNDTFGHDIGDELLIEVAARITDNLRKSDVVCRLGGDEFTVILNNPKTVEDIGKISEEIIHSLQRAFKLKDHEAFIGASIGIATYPDNGQDFETLTKNADLAMYQAKDAGRGTYRFYSEEMNAKSAFRLTMEADLRRAIEEKQFTLFYQPKVEIAKNRTAGMEALIRWNHPKKGMVSPADFIPLAEETGLIVPMGDWALETACRQTKELLDKGVALRVAVNLSTKQFQDPGLLDKVKKTLSEAGLPSQYLELEITESIAMQDVEETIATVEALRQEGIHISIDDFGTGYSSLSYLKKFPLHSLKVDQSFVRDLTVDSDDAAIVESVISMAHAMGLSVVAEGVETEEQLAFIRDRECAQVQGYFFSKPLPFEQLLDYVNAN